MKIKTITCNNVDNHGAILQALALMEYLHNLDNDVEIIDYLPKYFNKYRPFLCNSPKYENNVLLKIAYIIIKFPKRTIGYYKWKYSDRRKSFDQFKGKYLKFTKTYHNCDELLKDTPEADLFIAGSDQIWNTMMDNGKDPSYYLQFVKNAKTATYAASFSVREVPLELKDTIGNYIKKINYVSVRESSALKILDDLGIHSGTLVLDPVFLLNKSQWENVASSVKFDDDYVLVYDFENNENVKKQVTSYAKQNNLKIYSLYNNDYCDKSFEDYGPDVFLALIRDANFIISNSFHATAFSLIYQKEFFVINRKEKINSRMEDLLSIVELKNRMGNIIDCSELIDYKKVNIKLNKHLNNSQIYLEKIVNI